MPRIISTLRGWAVALTALGIAGLLLIDAFGSVAKVFGAPLGATSTQSASPTSSATPSGSASPSPSPSATDEGCAARFKQVTINDGSYRLDGTFRRKYADQVIDRRIGESLGDAQRDLLLDDAAQSAVRLAAWSYALQLYGDPNDTASLVDDGCLSAKGFRVYNAFKDALDDNETLFDETDAPRNGYNSGIENGTYGIDSDRGVTGNRRIITITLADDTVAWILIRSGNPVYARDPGLDTVATDNPSGSTSGNGSSGGSAPSPSASVSTPADDAQRQPGDGADGANTGSGPRPTATPSGGPQSSPDPVQKSDPSGNGGSGDGSNGNVNGGDPGRP